MAKPRKMLGSAQSPYIHTLMRLIETQSMATIARWCTDYAQAHFLGIYEKTFPEDDRPEAALAAAHNYFEGKAKLAEVKKCAAGVNAAAREAEGNPAAQAAARAVAAAVASVGTPTSSLGIAFYGAAAIAYDRVGTHESAETYDQIASEESAKMEAALAAVAVEDEQNPAKINWYC